MNKKSKQTVWTVVVVVLIIGGFISARVLTVVAELRSKGLVFCEAHFENETGHPIDRDDLTYVYKETVFPTPFDKRFRSECIYGNRAILMEAKPLGEWSIIDSYEID